jgi:hypothetical protein
MTPGGNPTASFRIRAENLSSILAAIVGRQIQSTHSGALAENGQYLLRERENREQWADDQRLAAKQFLMATMTRIHDNKRSERIAEAVEHKTSVGRNLKSGLPTA